MLTVLGWLGALLALVAYAQTGTRRFRQIALLSSAALLTFNLLLGIWSNAALEVTLTIVNVRRLVQLRGAGRASAHQRTKRRSVSVRRTREASGPSIRRTPSVTFP